MMKTIPKLLILFLAAVALSSCGAIPTLPPLEATVTIRTPRFTSLPPVESSPTLDASPLEPTETATAWYSPTVEDIPTESPPASATPTVSLPSPSPTATASHTPQPTATATPVPYKLQVMNPYYLSNFTHLDLGCDWLGVAGQVFNLAGTVQTDLLIKAGGDLAGEPIVEEMTMPLTHPETDLAYGPGGYELTLSNTPVESDSTAWVQLFSLDGDPLSEKIYLVTYDDCQKNLILLNFTE